MTRPRLRHKLALAGIAALLALGGLEIAARAYARLAMQDRLLTHDGLLGWKPRAGARKRYTSEEAPYLIEINSHGLRDREHPYAKPPGVFRILFLGDSFVFGSGGVEYGRRFTELLESAAPRVEVINAGVPGYSSDQEFLYLQSEGHRYQPDLVVVGAFMNDFVEAFRPFNWSIQRPKGRLALEGGELRVHSPSLGVLYRAMQSSYVLALADQRLHLSWRLMRPPASDQLLDLTTRYEALRKLFVAMRDFCAARGAGFAVVFFPLKSQKDLYDLQQVLDDVASSAGIPVLDLHGLIERPGDAASPFFQRDVHLNDLGHARAAELLAEFLSRRTSFGDHVRRSGGH
jgi:lysophospholipase L1-like esterase